MSRCISSGGRYFPNPPYEIEAFLLDRGGTVVHSQVFSSDEFEVELSLSSVSYGGFGERLLEEINAARAGYGLHPVRDGGRMIAQSYAESMIDGCYSSHWDDRGLKPYMRYSLAGGVSANAEIWVGRHHVLLRE